MAMMSLGMFVFNLSSASYDELQQKISWRHAANSRIGQRAARQFLGPDDENITLSGVLMPALTGGEYTLSWLRELGDQGESLPLIDGSGSIYGFFVLDDMDITRTAFFEDGAARKIEFKLTLSRVEDGDIDQKMALNSVYNFPELSVNGILDMLPPLPQLPALPPIVGEILSLPGMPKIPGLPRLPKWPQVPGLPKLPGWPKIPGIPPIPGLPQLPSLPPLPELPKIPPLPGLKL